MPRNLIIVDDQGSLASALDHLLCENGWNEVLQSTDLEDARCLLGRVRPSLLMVALHVAEASSLPFIRSVHGEQPHLPVAVFDASEATEDAIDAMRAGAVAFIPKTCGAEELCRAIEAAADGQMWLPSPMLGPVLRNLLDPPPADEWHQLVASLSEREGEVLQLMVDGLDRREISDRLIISLNTVRTHVKNILARLGVHSSLEAISLALHAGLRPNGATER